jgi:hypothetical protein
MKISQQENVKILKRKVGKGKEYKNNTYNESTNNENIQGTKWVILEPILLFDKSKYPIEGAEFGICTAVMRLLAK